MPPTFGVTTTVNFQPLGEGKVAINGDIVMTGPEVQKVIQALRAGNISLVTVHNHSCTDEPRLFYLHYWAVDDGVTLAKAMRAALDVTNLQPAKMTSVGVREHLPRHPSRLRTWPSTNSAPSAALESELV